ncbi:MAG: MerR family transcriptional regulator [Segetibacter sp.]|nr:MerR family transcriptional regulator [Segetibacter sp.]
MNAFTIKDVENLSGIKAHTIRIWEQRYNFLKPSRSDTNIRYYSNTELKTILNIALLNKYGFKISHINRMEPEEVKNKILSLSHADAQLERIVNELIELMIEFKVDAFEESLTTYITDSGIEKTIKKVIFPFLEKVGFLWLTEHINPAQEHLVSNIIRQKLSVAIDKLPAPVNPKTNFLLFLPEGEYHELGLLFMYYLLKSHGIKVLYIGANVPLNDLSAIANLKTPDYIHAHLTSISHNFNLERYLHNLHKHVPHVPVLLSGPLTLDYKKTIPPNVRFKKSLSALIEFIENL